jgi:hypothetical protein
VLPVCHCLGAIAGIPLPAPPAISSCPCALCSFPAEPFILSSHTHNLIHTCPQGQLASSITSCLTSILTPEATDTVVAADCLPELLAGEDLRRCPTDA